ncbi:glucosaminidase domain-containing protein, partial [Candidatus Curtissbacteria bacterium]|nr:glucosaminidase domain-containing protein [Candidatus Curtissbacteria bacterium]
VKLETKNGVEGQVIGLEITDLRPYLVENFLKGAPLAPHSKLIVEVSDQYGIDYRLIPAIAMKETGGGETAPDESYNAWGFGNGRVNFDSWEEAVVSVAKVLKRDYIDRGLVTPEQIMAVYAPPQLLTGGKWADDINFFFQKLESL